MISWICHTKSSSHKTPPIGHSRADPEKGRLLMKSEKRHGSRDDKIKAARRALRIVFSCVPVIGAWLLGAILGTHLSDGTRTTLFFVMVAAFLLPPVSIPVNLLLAKCRDSRMERIPPDGRHAMLRRKKEQARRSVKEAGRTIRRLIALSDAWGIFLALDAVLFVLSGAACLPHGFRVLPGVIALPFLFLLSRRIRFRTPAPDMAEYDRYLPEDGFPCLYGTARRAADAAGCENCALHLVMNDETSMSLSVVGGAVILYLAADLLCLFSEEELYTILLHLCVRAEDMLHHPPIENYDLWHSDEENDKAVSSPLFRYLRSLYCLHYTLYSCAVAEILSRKADRTAFSAAPEVSASALLKQYRYERYKWEYIARNHSYLPYAEEKRPYDSLARQFALMVEGTERRKEVWDGMLSDEIPDICATAPTCGERIRALGIDKPHTIADRSSPAFRRETQDAMAFLNRVMCDCEQEDYDRQRRWRYLAPKKKIEDWEAAGEPLAADGYHDILNALTALGQADRALALCDRVISCLPPAGTAFACLVKGSLLLRRFDPAGVELLLHAYELDNGYGDDVSDVLDTYFRLTGNRAELERIDAMTEQSAE